MTLALYSGGRTRPPMNPVMWKTLAVLGLLSATLSPLGDLPGNSAEAQPSGVTVRGVVEGDIVEGRVSRAVPETRTITLDNGQEYLVPPVLAANWEVLQTGPAVRLRYSVDRGRNVATLVELRPDSGVSVP
jgi:Protein of unknown function (DUF1344)